MLKVDTVAPKQSWAPEVVDDEDLASKSQARILITACASEDVEALARRVHDASPRALLPFVQIGAVDLPADPRLLRATCSSLLSVARGGTMFISDVEQMSASAQGLLLEVIAELERTTPSSAAVRLMSGTTVALVDAVATGAFSERLFYRLNTIHLRYLENAPPRTALQTAAV
jgi:DNA-binding NtrC family response regulator